VRTFDPHTNDHAIAVHIPFGISRNEMVLDIDAAQTLLDVSGLPAPSIMQGRCFLSLAEGLAVRVLRISAL